MTKPGKICSIQDNAYGPSNIVMMTVISWTAKSKAQIWDLFAHGEYFQPHRALIKHWIQKWIITKEENCKGWNFHFFTHYLTWLLLPPFGTKPLRAEQNNSSRVLFWMMEALDWCHLLPSGGHGDDERPQAGCMLLLNCQPTGLPSCLPLHQGLLLPRSILWPLSFERWWILHCST